MKIETGAVVAGVALVVGAGMYYQFKKLGTAISGAHTAGRETIKPVTDAVWNVYSFLKGEPVYPETSTSAFFLNEKYVKADGTIDASWRRSIELMNQGNAALFNLITDSKGRLKAEYRHLVGGEVSTKTAKPKQ